jgi:hypothetical protein
MPPRWGSIWFDFGFYKYVALTALSETGLR